MVPGEGIEPPELSPVKHWWNDHFSNHLPEYSVLALPRHGGTFKEDHWEIGVSSPASANPDMMPSLSRRLSPDPAQYLTADGI